MAVMARVNKARRPPPARPDGVFIFMLVGVESLWLW